MGTPADRLPAFGPQEFILGNLDLPEPLAAPDQSPGDGDGQGRRRRPRYSPGTISGLPLPWFLRGTAPILRWGPPALLAFAPLAWGSVEGWAEMVVVTGSAVIAAVWLLRLALFPDHCTAEWSAGRHQGSWSAGLHLPLLAVAGVGVLQMVPLGPLVAVISPVGAEIQRQAGLADGAQRISLAWPESLRALAQFAGFALLFLAVFDGLHGRAEVRRLAAVFLTLGFFHALGGILWHYQSTGQAYWVPAAGGSSFGPYINRNHFACLMGMTVPLGVGFLLSLGHRHRATTSRPGSSLAVAVPPPGPERGAQRFLIGFVVVVMTGALGLSLSRGGIVSTLAALSALALALGARRLTRGHLWKAAAAVSAALAFTVWLAAGPLVDRLGPLTSLFGINTELTPRAVIWEDTLRLAVDFPLFGSGFGTFAAVYPRYQTVYPEHRVLFAHNDWLQLLAEGGLAGTLTVLALLGGYVAVAAKRLGRRHDREAIFLALGGLGGLLAFLLHAGTEFNAHIPANALWFTVLAAFTLKALFSKREQPS